ncbi:scarecrow-like protein 8 [Nicotiana tabacum]|uniref:Scarecrow-like protein 8 n=2 Tax=Nicotiana tabacum TaxID=4097 RepID=A0AC58UPV6_TOBAC|nr:PREDICTED: scarecrow-like protein 8 isoform X1 [Nicotiana tabacum]
MSSGFPGDFYGAGGINTGRSTMNNNTLRSQLSGILPDPATQIVLGRPNLMGKRSLAEFQQQQQFQFLQQQQQQNQQQQMILQQQQQQQGLGFYLRNVKPRNYQQASPIDFSAVASSISSEFSSFSSNSNASTMNTRHTLPVLQQLRSQPALPSANTNISGFLHPGTQNYSTGVHSRATIGQELLSQESEKKMMNQLQELEKQLLDDVDDEDGDTVSVVTNNEWSETIQNLISPCQSQNQNQNQNQKLASLSPSSSTSSCASSTESPPISCPKQSITEAATAISEGINHVAVEILTRLSQVSNVRGSSIQRLTAYMVSALRSRVNPTDYPPPVLELHSKEHTVSTQNLYEVSPCFKLGFMAANLAILEAVTDHPTNKIHVIDFDVGQGGQYLHLLHALAAKKSEKPAVLKITAFTELVGGVDDRLNAIGVELKAVANKIGVCLYFNVMACKITDLSREKLGLEHDEALAVNFAFKLYRLPDESVTTENLRDELLRRVKGLSPKVVTVVEQELNGNTAPFLARVNEACGYYGALFDSLDATVSRDNLERVRIEEGLSRKMANSVACEGRDRVERCEVFGKWRARMSMAGFVQRPMSQLVANSLCSKLNSGTRGNPGFTVNEQSGGICFGWMGRTLTVASAWR